MITTFTLSMPSPPDETWSCETMVPRPFPCDDPMFDDPTVPTVEVYPPPTLPETGFATGVLIGSGLILTAMGLVLAFVANRPRRPRPRPVRDDSSDFLTFVPRSSVVSRPE